MLRLLFTIFFLKMVHHDVKKKVCSTHRIFSTLRGTLISAQCNTIFTRVDEPVVVQQKLILLYALY